jgi:predicted DsbA family dithiol-disulfide isomerase
MKIKIEIWSDIVCPFCYIGKRHLERALEKFEHRGQVELEWKSFELDPHAERNPGGSLNERLAQKYGQTVQWAQQMHAQMTEQAKSVGLEYRFDQAVPTNTLDAHRLIHLASQHGLQDQAEERLFQAYYSRGEHVGDLEQLTQIGIELGLPEPEVKQALQSDAFASEVRQDEQEAQELGIQAVPFFLLNRRYAVSGAQPVEVFQRALQKAWEDRIEPISPGKGDEGGERDEGSMCGPQGCEPA